MCKIVLHVHLGRSSPCRNYSLLGIAYPVVGPPFKYKEYARIRRSLEADIEKKVGL